jgi:Ca2+-binding EF-hand superfamily protein
MQARDRRCEFLAQMNLAEPLVTGLPPSVAVSKNITQALPTGQSSDLSLDLTSAAPTNTILDTSQADTISLLSDTSIPASMATIPESVVVHKLPKISNSQPKNSILKKSSKNQENLKSKNSKTDTKISKTNKAKESISNQSNSSKKSVKLNRIKISPRMEKSSTPEPKVKISKAQISKVQITSPYKETSTKEAGKLGTQQRLSATSARKSMHNSAFTTQVNRLLKQNTQELFENLLPEVRKAFQTLFDRIDVTDSGAITAKEIQHLIRKNTNKNLTLSQVQKVLCDLDVKGTGDIEFDEFIFMLSQPSNYVRLLDKRDLKGKMFEKYTKKQDDSNETTTTFFEALRNVTKQDSMTALHIRGFYKNRLKKLNDHVIHDWSAGQRCIGLSDQECLKRYETIQGELLRQRVNFSKDNSYKTSPYARPLEWGVMNLREAIVERRTKAKELKAKKPEIKKACKPECVPAKTVVLPKYSIEKRSPLKKTFNYDQLADIRNKVDDIANEYYGDLKSKYIESSKAMFAVDENGFKSEQSKASFMHTFDAYCAPFVVSPWIPVKNGSPTLRSSFSPLGRSKNSTSTSQYKIGNKISIQHKY